MKLNQKLKDELWWLIISVECDYSRIKIAEHELSSNGLTLWLEDTYDFKNSLDECLQLDVPIKSFEKIIRAENLNSYESSKMHPKKGFMYKTRIEISQPLAWYREDASIVEQQWAREAVLKIILTNLVEGEINDEITGDLQPGEKG